MMESFEFALMLPGSCLFEITGDTATGHWYLLEYTRDKEGTGTTALSRYLDTYSKYHRQWLFQSREYNFIYNGPADLSGTFTPPAG